MPAGQGNGQSFFVHDSVPFSQRQLLQLVGSSMPIEPFG